MILRIETKNGDSYFFEIPEGAKTVEVLEWDLHVEADGKEIECAQIS